MSFFLNLRLTLKIDFKKFACFVFVFPFCCCFYFVCSNSSSVCDRAKLKERALSQPPSPLSLKVSLSHFHARPFEAFFRAFFFCFFDNIAYYAYSACQLVLSVDFFPAAAATAVSLGFVCLCVCCALLSQFVFLLLICRRRDDFCSLIRVAGLVRSFEVDVC